MAEDTVPQRLQAFIANHVGSIELLEVLLLMHAERDRAWAAEEVGARLRLSAVSASQHLVALRQRGLLSVALAGDAVYRYQPSPALAGVVDELAQLYRERRLLVADLVATRPRSKLRLFADAF
jgi:hypothetical protein